MTEIGKKAPAFSLSNQKDETVKLSDFLGKWVALFFYPKDDTPGCTVEACSMSDNLPKFKKIGAEVLGVSPDSAKRHRAFIERKALKINLLADEEKEVCEKYGVWVEKSMYGRKYMGVARTTFIIDPKGVVAHVFEKVKPKDHGEEVAAMVAELKKAG